MAGPTSGAKLSVLKAKALADLSLTGAKAKSCAGCRLQWLLAACSTHQGHFLQHDGCSNG